MTTPTPMRTPDPSTPVERVWHAHVDDLPPPALDAAILAAAHRAAQSAPVAAAAAATRKFRTTPRWWMPLAAAATLGAVTLGIVQLAPDGDEVFAPVATPTRPAALPGAAPVPGQPAAKLPVLRESDVKSNAGSNAESTGKSNLETNGAGKSASLTIPRTAAGVAAKPAADRATPASPSPETARTDQSLAAAKSNALRAPAGAGRIAPAPSPPAAPLSTPSPASPSANAPAPLPAPAPSAAIPAPVTPAPMQSAARAPQSVEAPAAAPEPFPGSVAKRAPIASSASLPEARSEAADAATAPSARDRLAASPPPSVNTFAGTRPRSAMQTDSGVQTGSHAPSIADEWIARIARLHKDGNDVAAATELRAFRAAYPDADRRLPPDLREWAATIRP